MKEELIQFETAKLAKEKGFDWKVLDCYNENEEIGDEELRIYINYNSQPNIKGSNTNLYSAPTQSLLQMWLWEKYQIWIEITLWGDGMGFVCLIKQAKGEEDDGSTIVRQIGLVDAGFNLELHSNPYKLLERGLQESLKLIK